MNYTLMHEYGSASDYTGIVEGFIVCDNKRKGMIRYLVGVRRDKVRPHLLEDQTFEDIDFRALSGGLNPLDVETIIEGFVSTKKDVDDYVFRWYDNITIYPSVEPLTKEELLKKLANEIG